MTSAEHTIGDLLNEHNRLTLDVIRGEHSPCSDIVETQCRVAKTCLRSIRQGGSA